MSGAGQHAVKRIVISPCDLFLLIVVGAQGWLVLAKTRTEAKRCPIHGHGLPLCWPPDKPEGIFGKSWTKRSGNGQNQIPDEDPGITFRFLSIRRVKIIQIHVFCWGFGRKFRAFILLGLYGHCLSFCWVMTDFVVSFCWVMTDTVHHFVGS